MTDKFRPAPLRKLLEIILNEYDGQKSIFGIYEEQFFIPNEKDAFRSHRFDRLLETPVGVAAGPHTQLSRNIIAAWLTGARYIELKTVQTLDELEVSKPCIDMQDEGYNCEWSQELKIRQSFDEYLNAWILIHILKDKLNIGNNSEPGFIFNMSVGYDLSGIMKDNVQWFFDKMQDASDELNEKIKEIKDLYPDVVHLNIGSQMTDNITLSTMHGCPPDEIEQIADYLISKRKLHTTIKLNPTLLGKKELREIISNSGFNTDVPDEAFEHDVKYADALGFIKRLTEKAKENKVFFGLKLTNTLESRNNKTVFPENEKMMYASGKVLHPISVNVARILQNDFGGKLDISFSGGADAFNIADIVKCGLYPVTVSSDLLKPGGYGRLKQYIDNLRNAKLIPSKENKLLPLNDYADFVKISERYKKDSPHDPSIKTHIPLGKFDCTFAPCEATCPTNQAIPSYMYYTSKGDFEKAYEVILETNPFPNATGMVCDHTCQTKCTRINYDTPLRIRDIKRFVTERHNDRLNNESCVADTFRDLQNTFKKVAVIGAGPSGLSAAYFLNKAGFALEVFEYKEKGGGMVSAAIPKFRLGDNAVEIDMNNIEEEGVKVHYGQKIGKAEFEKLREDFDYVYIGAGAQDAIAFTVEGDDAEGLLDPLDFLFAAKKGAVQDFGTNVVIIGGGNTAMDAARTACRLTGSGGKVTILYRRTIKQMPAEYQEIKDVLSEGIEIAELVNPIKINSENGKIISLTCRRMKLGEKDASGRARPVEIPGSDFEFKTDTIIPAIGQRLAVDFADEKLLQTEENSYETKISHVYIGGDAKRNASTLIKAIGDGRKAAQEIIDREGIDFKTKSTDSLRLSQEDDRVKNLMLQKTKRIEGIKVRETDLSDRKNFNLVSSGMTKEEAVEEASRCLLCDEVCNVCTTLCPNLALQHYETEKVKYNLQKIVNGKIEEAGIFEITQNQQIIHIADWCNMCANCETFCPTSGAPYKEKPHLYLDKTSFVAEKDGYYYDNENETLLAKESGFDFSLTERNDFYLYQSDNLLAKLDKQTFRLIEYTGADETDCDFKKAAEMSIILKGAKKY